MKQETQLFVFWPNESKYFPELLYTLKYVKLIRLSNLERNDRIVFLLFAILRFSLLIHCQTLKGCEGTVNIITNLKKIESLT